MLFFLKDCSFREVFGGFGLVCKPEVERTLLSQLLGCSLFSPEHPFFPSQVQHQLPWFVTWLHALYVKTNLELPTLSSFNLPALLHPAALHNS